MPQTCTVCRSKKRREIDAALIAGQPLRDIARQYGLSKDSASRHRSHHLTAALAQAEEIKHEDLVGEIRDLKKRLWRGLSRVEAAGNDPATIAYVRELRGITDQLLALKEKGMVQSEVRFHIVYDSPSRREPLPVSAKRVEPGPAITAEVIRPADPPLPPRPAPALPPAPRAVAFFAEDEGPQTPGDAAGSGWLSGGRQL